MKDGYVNLATDMKRELDHRYVTKCFRSGSTMSSVMRRMSLIDSLTEVHDLHPTKNQQKQKDDDLLGWEITKTDLTHIRPVVLKIMQRGGLSINTEDLPYNVYTESRHQLSSSMLDDNCGDVSTYLITKFLVHEKLCGLKSSDIPEISSLNGPKELIAKAKNSNGVTIKRSGRTSVAVPLTDRQQKEAKRKKILSSENKQVGALSSEMNACQALVKPDCSKYKVMKRAGISQALADTLCTSLGQVNISVKAQALIMTEKKLVLLAQAGIPQNISSSVKLITLEFAGVKFKSVHAETGEQYLSRVQNAYIMKSLNQFPRADRMIICEEKYRYTPDTFKAATRAQRVDQNKTENISHLKSADEILGGRQIDPVGIRTTSVGKAGISTFLAVNIHKIVIKKDVTIDIDSEFVQVGCSCTTYDSKSERCNCDTYCVPLRCKFTTQGLKDVTQLESVHQRKGEAEMSQVDWLLNSHENLVPGDDAVSIVTSGDIDAITIHLMALAMHWPRDATGEFIYPVYVVLQKPEKKVDIYNITSIIWILELGKNGDIGTAVKVAVGLCMGGNNFIPKLQYVSHTDVLQLFMESTHFRQNLLRINYPEMTINDDVYLQFVKELYCSKLKLDKHQSFNTIRNHTILKKRAAISVNPGMSKLINSPNRWMPPASALIRIGHLINLQVQYLLSAGKHEAHLPNFLASDCLVQTATGEVEFDFGPDCRISTTELAIIIGTHVTPKKANKPAMIKTPQRGRRKKKATHSTPLKDMK